MTSLDADTTSGATTTSGPPVDCMASNGELDAACPENAPFCVDEACVGCTNPLADCAAVGAPGGDVCDASSGACVLCTEVDASACMGATPVCDGETNECVSCTAHEQCAPSACNLFEGSCVGGMVVNAGPMQQYTTLNNAVNALAAAGSEGTVIVHPGLYNESVAVVGSGVAIAFLAGPGAPPDWQRTSAPSAPQLRANSDATVLVEGILFRANNSASEPALRADEGARLWVDRSTVAQNSGVGVRSEVNSELVLRNMFVTGANNLTAVSVITGSNATIQYSSLLGNLGTSRALSCDGRSSVMVSDSILLALGSVEEVACDGINVDTTATATLAGTTMVGAADAAWFEDVPYGDLHLTEAGENVFEGIARWNAGDPLVDFDGDDRSGMEDAMEHAGADFIR